MVGKTVSVLDEVPFPTRHPDAQKLLRVLLDTYRTQDTVRRFVREAGLSDADVGWEGRPMIDVWPDVLDYASRKRRLRALVEAVKGHPDSSAYDDLFRQLLTPPKRGWYAAPDPY